MEKFGISKANLPEVVALDYDKDRYFYAEGYKVSVVCVEADVVVNCLASELREVGARANDRRTFCTPTHSLVGPPPPPPPPAPLGDCRRPDKVCQ